MLALKLLLAVCVAGTCRCCRRQVGNAQEELVRWYHEQNDHGRIVLTDKPEAAGVLEGLARHGLY